jgi:hypothetical protein
MVALSKYERNKLKGRRWEKEAYREITAELTELSSRFSMSEKPEVILVFDNATPPDILVRCLGRVMGIECKNWSGKYRMTARHAGRLIVQKFQVPGVEYTDKFVLFKRAVRPTLSASKLLEKHAIRIVLLPELFSYFYRLYTSPFPLMHLISSNTSSNRSRIETKETRSEITYPEIIVGHDLTLFHEEQQSHEP